VYHNAANETSRINRSFRFPSRRLRLLFFEVHCRFSTYFAHFAGFGVLDLLTRKSLCSQPFQVRTLNQRSVVMVRTTRKVTIPDPD